jgi:hypothetical protein
MFSRLIFRIIFPTREGKTNHGQKLYGRAMRHADVVLCPVGGLSFYLGMRFAMTSEFDEFTLDDWLDNKKWFDIKLLVDTSRHDVDLKKSMSSDSYASAIKKVLQELGLPLFHLIHIGRVVGPKILEMLEAERDEIRTLGNWDPSMQEKCYSTKMPMSAIRKIAGFVQSNSMHYNPRTQPIPSDDLKKKTSFGWAFGACDLLERAIMENRELKFTALNFLRMMKEMATIFLQDAAALWIEHPERRTHPLFSLDVFRESQWEVSEKTGACIRFSFLTTVLSLTITCSPI